MRKYFLFLVMLLPVLHVMADNRFYISDFSVDPGATVDVSIMLDNDVTDFASFQADLYLPSGLELVQQYNEDDDEYYVFSLTTRARSRMSIGSATQSDGAVRMMLTQTIGSTMQTIKDTSGAMVTFQVKASDSASGTLYMNLRNIVFTTTSSAQYNLQDSQTQVTVTGSTNPDPDPSTGNRFYISDFSVDPGATVDVSIMLDNDVTDFASFQADLYLPSGLELVQQYNEDDDEYYVFSLTTRARSRMSIGSATQSDGAVRMMLTQTIGSTMQTIKDTSGAMVTFQVKASDSASGTLYMNLKNIVFTTSTSTQYNLQDCQTKVTVTGSSASAFAITTDETNLFTGMSQKLKTSGNVTNVAWTSNNNAVATVSAEGVVNAIAPGTAIINCTASDNSTASFTVNVLSIGDINRDGKITIADVTALVDIILGK